MAPLEPWEKVLVDGEAFLPDVHGQIPCEECHGGVQAADKESAHDGLLARPSDQSESVCGQCHPDVTVHAENSLHNNLQGYWTVLDARSGGTAHETLEVMFGNHCDSCHASCGDCHISQPASVGGGLISGHVVNREPSMTRNCTACHGSRVGNEYMGKHEDIKADVHFRQGRMTCVDCHSSREMHGYPQACDTCHTAPETGIIPPPDHRYDGVQSPSCESCHAAVTIANDDIEMHELHAGDLSCQVCHSMSYTSCDGCHVAVSETSGNPYFATEASYLGFYIGKNALKSFNRPYDYVTVRHVPVSSTSFEYYGEDLLPDFDVLPTWTYATPHNIQRNTPQTESCVNCHNNPDLFLTVDKVKPEEIKANLDVIVFDVPPSIIDLMRPPTIPEPTQSITTTEVITP